MNYRHGFHAGNLADVIKHTALVEAQRLLVAKDKPLMLLDTHAGRGAYDLRDEQSMRGGEARSGVLQLAARTGMPPALGRYLAAVRAYDTHCGNRTGEIRHYPGSPRLLRQGMRTGDRLILCEMEGGEEQRLHREFAGDRRVEIRRADGFQSVKLLLPPPERRGLVLVDPPYERRDELEKSFTALSQGLRRFATGVFMLWYPIKESVTPARLAGGLDRLPPSRVLRIEYRHAGAAPRPGRRHPPLTGSGLIVVNPPWQFADALQEALAWLASHDTQATFDVRWLREAAAPAAPAAKRPAASRLPPSSAAPTGTSREPHRRRPPRSPRSA